MAYYIVKVKIVTTDDKGRQKKSVEQYLVKAVSVTDAETKIHDEFKNDSLDFEVTAVVEIKIVKVINQGMVMEFTTGSMIILSAFKKVKVGEILEKTISKNGIVYMVKAEDGKVYENICIDVKKSNVFIHSSFTNSFLKSNENGKNKS